MAAGFFFFCAELCRSSLQLIWLEAALLRLKHLALLLPWQPYPQHPILVWWSCPRDRGGITRPLAFKRLTCTRLILQTSFWNACAFYQLQIQIQSYFHRKQNRCFLFSVFFCCCFLSIWFHLKQKPVSGTLILLLYKSNIPVERFSRIS